MSHHRARNVTSLSVSAEKTWQTARSWRSRRRIHHKPLRVFNTRSPTSPDLNHSYAMTLQWQSGTMDDATTMFGILVLLTPGRFSGKERFTLFSSCWIRGAPPNFARKGNRGGDPLVLSRLGRVWRAPKWWYFPIWGRKSSPESHCKPKSPVSPARHLPKGTLVKGPKKPPSHKTWKQH